MASLILSLDGNILQEVELAKPRTTIGRRPHNDIVIDNLAVSGEHAAIVKVGQDLILEDGGSTNGTLLNGQPTEKHLLKDGDLIEIGKFHLKFMVKPQHQEPDFEKTMLIRSPFAGKALGADDTQPVPSIIPAAVADPFPTTFSPEMQASAPAPAAAPSVPTPPAAPHAALRVLTGKQAGTEIAISKPLTSIGKKDVQVAVITRRPNGYFLSHVQGARTPAINSIPITEKPHPLGNRDLIEIAGVRMEFLIK